MFRKLFLLLGLKYKINDGFGYFDVLAGVSLLAIIALGTIKVVEVKYNQNIEKVSSYEVQRLIEKIKNILENKTACRKTFKGKNLVRFDQKIREIRDNIGDIVLSLNKKRPLVNYNLKKMESENISLDYDEAGIFYLNFLFTRVKVKGEVKNRYKNINTKIQLHGNVDSKGRILSCYSNEGGFFIKSIQAFCRKF